jgi:hypothetical protein
MRTLEEAFAKFKSRLELHQKMSYFDEMITKIGNALFGQKAGATPEGGSE